MYVLTSFSTYSVSFTSGPVSRYHLTFSSPDCSQANLAAPCMRYLLMENLTHGQAALADDNYDFAPRKVRRCSLTPG